MAIHNNSSYIPTINEFLAHWSQVDATLTPDLVISAPDQSAMTCAAFATLRDTLQDQLQQVTGFLNDKEIARGGILIDKTRMLALFNEFNAMLDGYWSATPFINARAYAPSLTDSGQTFLAPIRDALSLWEKLNAAPAPAGITLPLELSDGTTVADFASEIASLQAAYATEANANQNAVLARSQRDLTMATAKAIMVSYRKIVPARCAQHPALVDTLPAVTPPPGHTPEPVTATAIFVAPDQAKVTHTPSTEATLARIELRGNPGERYDEDDAVVIETHGPTDPYEFLTNFGLTQPGTQVALKIVVVLTTGNEASTPAMIITRPA